MRRQAMYNPAPMASSDRSRFTAWLDGIDTAASVVFLILVVVIAAVGVTVLGYVVLRAPASLGSQGEWFYLGLAALLVVGWAFGQIVWLLQRRRRRSASGHLEIPSPTIESGPSGWSIQWGKPPSEGEPRAGTTWTWGTGAPIASGSRAFKVDAAQLEAARAARREGRPWDAIGRLVNPEYDALDAMERMLFDRALRMAVEPEETSNPGA
jgi:hypothetical protein